jgi:hypothetical protein
LEELKVTVEPFLRYGDSYRVMDPQDFFGRPVDRGTCRGNTIGLPVKGEFGVFVILRSG